MGDSSTPGDFQATLKPRSTTFPFNLGQPPQTPFPKKSETTVPLEKEVALHLQSPVFLEVGRNGQLGFLVWGALVPGSYRSSVNLDVWVWVCI